MKVVLLCGGLGTRLREETEFRPKPMVEIGGRPILWHIMKGYAEHGFRRFVVCLGYRGDVIKRYFLDYEAMNADFTIRLGTRSRVQLHDAHEEQDFEVTLAETGQDTMTGGRLARIERYLGDDDTFLATYGDGLADVDLGALVRFHRSHGRLATLTAVRPVSRFGVLDLGGDGGVERFREKPHGEGWISAGFFVFHRSVLERITGDDCVLEEGPLASLAAEGQLMAYRHEGFFQAMDTWREYKALNEIWQSQRAPWQTCSCATRTSRWSASPAAAPWGAISPATPATSA